ncbi:MAG: translation initiation factor [Nitrospirae bacterium]|nr:translation initiation factor [Nitrospirota bacterium]
MPDENETLVYSTDRTIPGKGKPAREALHAVLQPALQKVTVRVDRKARRGRSVTVVEGIRMPDKEREAFLKKLKAELGTGGTLTLAGLEIQGDHCDSLLAALRKMGYRPKRSGS